jgi:peptidoglycan hydrolase FlgJ
MIDSNRMLSTHNALPIHDFTSKPKPPLISDDSLPKPVDQPSTQEAFTEFVGQTLFGSMLASMRKSVGKPAYMHGGRTEEVFQQQLDQLIVEDMTEASADTIAEPMFNLFNMQRRS